MTGDERRAARAAYMAEWRSRPDNRRRQSWSRMARGRALTRLANQHRDSYAVLYAEELGRIKREARKAQS